MKLIKQTELHIKEMMTWFSDESSLRQWSGPGFRFPFEQQSFSEDLKLTKLDSYSLVDESGQLVAFGQFYLRKGKCHLGRLVVSPNHRGKGAAHVLMQALIELGCRELQVKSSSLFVLADNHSAIKAYQKEGFDFAEYPEEIPLENCLYMVK